MVPYLLHVIPILNDAMLDGIFNAKDSTLLLSFFSNVYLLLIEANHDARHLGTTDHCREH
jgi:hypothetical protein